MGWQLNGILITRLFRSYHVSSKYEISMLELELLKYQIHENMTHYVSGHFVLVDQDQIYNIKSVNTSQIKNGAQFFECEL